MYDASRVSILRRSSTSTNAGTCTVTPFSSRAGFVDSTKASNLTTRANDVSSLGRPVPLIAHLHGKFPTAFPEGAPAPMPTPNGAPPQDKPKETPALKEATAEGNVFLIADIDAFYDQFAYTLCQMGGMRVASPSNGNSSMLLNLLDHAVGSKHLIGSRSRAAVRRPFSVIQEMEDDFNKVVGAKIEELQKKEREATIRLNELQVQKTRGNQLFLSPEQEAEIAKLRQEQVKYAKQVRELQKDLRRQKDELTGRITLLNVAVMPLIVFLVGIGLLLQRRSSTRAR